MSFELFVSPKGNDHWSGRKASPNKAGDDGPFATIEAAQKAVRKLKRKGELTEPVRVIIRGGVYALKKPLRFGPEDSGSPAPTGGWNIQSGPERSVTYAAYPGETPVFSGGKRITGWKASQLNRRNVIRNNIFAYGGEAQFSRGRIEAHNSFFFTNNIVYFDTEGAVLAGNWKELNATIDRNLYWNASGKPLNFAGASFADWQARGADQHSLIADPGFRDPANGDFTLPPDSPATQIGFTPFDLSTVGPRR